MKKRKKTQQQINEQVQRQIDQLFERVGTLFPYHKLEAAEDHINDLVNAIKEIVDAWEGGNLAEAVNHARAVAGIEA